MQERGLLVVGRCRSGWSEALSAAGLEVAAEVDAARASEIAVRAGAAAAVVDDALAGPDPLGVAADLASRGLAVVLVGRDPSQDAIRQAMIHGVRDYLAEPFTGADLARALATATGHGQAKKRTGGQIVAICGARGGSGRSCLTVNLAIALGTACGEATAAVDLCMEYGALAHLAGVAAEQSVADACRANGPVAPDVLLQLLVGPPRLPLRILASPSDPSVAAEIAGQQARQPERNYVAEVLDGLRPHYPWTLVDLPPVPNEAWLTTLDRAAAVVVIATPDVAGLAATVRLLGLLDAIGVGPERRHVVLNAPWRPSPLGASAAATALATAVRLTIPYDPAVGQAADAGHPLVGRRHRSPFARAATTLAAVLADPAAAGSAAAEPAPAPNRAIAALGRRPA